MIKCLECGFETDRLQWTHFKYKCTGKFNNGTEYKKAYPNALLVSPELTNKTKLTLDNFIAKYGKEDGLAKWNSYRDKQAHSNSYEYKKEKHGWSKEEYDQFNSSRAITLTKCVERHGERLGLQKWNEYCEKQSYTNTKEYFVEQYGIEHGTKKFIEYNKQKGTANSPLAVSNKLGIAIEDAVEIILARSNANKIFGSNVEQEFTQMIENVIGELDYTTFSRPFGRWSEELNSYVVYDIKHADCIIEFNGDYWHCNPKLYESTDKIKGNRTAEQVWERDKKKIQTAINNGLRVLVVWESEFLKNKEETIERVIKWMQNGQK